jgi:transcriptional regulator with XRE-family HTH domain
MRHERGIEALDLHPIIKCLVETRLAWQLSVSDIAARMGSSYFTLKKYERGAEFPSGKMLLKWVDVLGFEMVLRHKERGVSGCRFGSGGSISNLPGARLMLPHRQPAAKLG